MGQSRRLKRSEQRLYDLAFLFMLLMLLLLQFIIFYFGIPNIKDRMAEQETVQVSDTDISL